MPVNKPLGILIGAVVAGFLTLVLVCWAYFRGAWYQPIKGSYTTFTEEDICTVRHAEIESYIKRGGTVDAKSKFSCPSANLVLVSVIFVFISLILSSIVLVFQLLGKSDYQSVRVQTYLMLAASIAMCLAGLLLIGFLISVLISNYLDQLIPICSPDKRGVRAVMTRSAPIPTEDDGKSCGSAKNYYYKHYQLIAALLFAIASGALSVFSALLLKKASTAVGGGMMMGGQVQSQYGQGSMMTPSQYGGGQMMPPNQYGGGQVMTPSQSQFPQAQ